MSIPAAGDFVEVRTRCWLFESVAGADMGLRARLACIDDDAQGETLEVLWRIKEIARDLTSSIDRTDVPEHELVDDRGGTFDPVNEQGKLADQKRRATPLPTHDIYTDPANLPEGLQRKPKGPLGPTIGRRGGNKD